MYDSERAVRLECVDCLHGITSVLGTTEPRLCTDCADRRKQHYCRGNCGKKLLKQYVLCATCLADGVVVSQVQPGKPKRKLVWGEGDY